jgi:hypothetical protein
MKMHLHALALMAAVALPTTASMPGTNGGSDPETSPGPIANYDRSAILAEADAARRRKHAAKMARRAASHNKF